MIFNFLQGMIIKRRLKRLSESEKIDNDKKLNLALKEFELDLIKGTENKEAYGKVKEYIKREKVLCLKKEFDEKINVVASAKESRLEKSDWAKIQRNWSKELVDLFERMKKKNNLDCTIIVEEYAASNNFILNEKLYSRDLKIINMICFVNGLDRLHMNQVNDIIENNRANIIKKNIYIIEKMLLGKDVHKFIKKFILNTTIKFDNKNMSIEKYKKKLEELGEFLNYKGLIEFTINFMILNYFIEKVKLDVYAEELDKKLNLKNIKAYNTIIKKCIDYYGNTITNDHNIKTICKIVNKSYQQVNKDVKKQKETAVKKYRMKKFEKELFGESNDLTIEKVDKLDGYEFEDFLGKLFTNLGYEVKQTGYSGDYGADLIISNGIKSIAIQASFPTFLE